MAREISDSGFMRASSRRRAENINFDVSPRSCARGRDQEAGGRGSGGRGERKASRATAMTATVEFL